MELKKHYIVILSFCVFSGIGFVIGACTPPGGGGGTTDPLAEIKERFETSLHNTREGKATFYEADDGFFSLTGIPISDLPCQKCHGPQYADGTTIGEEYEPGCADCHADPENPTGEIADSVCLNCHGRQAAEQNFAADVHKDAGFACIDCHKEEEMHGTGESVISFLANNATFVKCEDCHVEGGQAGAVPSNTSHTLHGDALACDACHVTTVSSCYNCHFESEVAETGKRFFAQMPRTGFKMLMNFNGKVTTATFQTLVNEGDTFVTIAPFHGHAITADGSACGDCHLQGGNGNQNLVEYSDTGIITVTGWDAEAEGEARLVGPNGVIPVPEDWFTALEFAFLDYTGNATDTINGSDNLALWDFLKIEKDGGHIVFGSPLTQEQMDKLLNN